MKGGYCLLARLEESKNLKTETKYFRLGPGYYVYVGSAMNGLQARLKHHMAEHKKMKWHIDYLLRETPQPKAFLFPANQKVECKLSEMVGKLSDATVQGFGSTDCQCGSHLFYFKDNPEQRLQELADSWKG